METSIENLSTRLTESSNNHDIWENLEIIKILELENSIEIALENLKIINSIEKTIQYYINFLDNKELKENTKWFSIDEIKEFKKNLNKLLITIYETLWKKNFKIIPENCIIDILGNWPHIYISVISKRIKNNNPNIGSLIEQVKTILEFVNIYIKAISFDEQKLYDTLTDSHGYIKNYSTYFQEKIDRNKKIYKVYPTGSNKLYYFAFFLSYELWNIGYANLEEELEKLDDNIINKSRIRRDFPNLERI